MIKLIDNKLVLDLNGIGRTKRQKMIIQKLVNSSDVDQLIAYSKSFQSVSNNLRKWTISAMRPRFDGDCDSLANKRPERYLTMYKNLTRLDVNHVPTNKEQSWIGVEIECMIPFESFNLDPNNTNCEYCDGSGVLFNDDDEERECEECEGFGVSDRGEAKGRKALEKLFTENKLKHVTVKSDGSIDQRHGYFPIEITVLTQIDKPANLMKVCDLLNKIEAKVNKSCGLHVHLDMRSKTEDQVKDIGKVFGKALPVLGAMVPKSRRNNSYCLMSVSKVNGSRYHAVNLTAFSKYKTLEIRLHSGTTDFQKIFNWVRLCSAIAKTEIMKKCLTINDLTEFVNIPEDIVEYMSQRVALFSENDQCTNVAMTDLDEAV